MAEGRGKSFTAEQDQAICNAFLCISQDPITGNNQRKESFWGRVLTKYEELTSDDRRTIPSIKARWSIIQKACNSYSGCLRKIRRQHHSGMALHDEIDLAKRLYKEEVGGKPFPNLDECWEILEHSVKFGERVDVDSTPILSQMETSPSRGTPEFSEIPSTFPSSDFGGTPTSTSGGSVQSPRKRPPGCKATKLKKGKTKVTEEEDQAIATFVQTYNQTRADREARKTLMDERKIAAIEARVHIDRMRAEVEKTRVESEAKKANDLIMGMDLDAIKDPRMRSYYELRKFEIMEEMTKNSSSNGYFPEY